MCQGGGGRLEGGKGISDMERMGRRRGRLCVLPLLPFTNSSSITVSTIPFNRLTA